MSLSQITFENPLLSVDFELFGRFLGHVAHDYNNLLTPVLAYPQLIKPALKEGSNVEDLVDAIEKTAKDMAHLSNQLLALSGGELAFRTPYLASDLLNQLFAQIVSVLPPGIKVQIAIQENLPELVCNLEEIYQVIENLITNAVEAMNATGEISVSTEVVQIARDSEFAPSNIYKGAFLSIRIKDTGPGIAPEIKDQMFSPFTTTKKCANKRGSGLGLAVVYKIMKNYGGFCEFSTDQGKGTEAALFFPCETATPEEGGDNAMSAQTQPVEPGVPKPCDRQKILLLDDEKIILKLFQMIIKSSLPDTSVDTAENGALGVESFKEHHHAVLVMDLHMPVMDGQTAFLEIERFCKEHNWEMPSVVFCTGFAPTEVINRIIMDSSKHCLLSKPVKGEVLVDAIRERLVV